MTWPLRRLLDPRFRDLSERIWSAREAVVHEVGETRAAVDRFEPVLASYTASSGESLTYVGDQLRALTDEVRATHASAVRLAGAEDLDALRAELAPGAIVVAALAPGAADPEGWVVTGRLELDATLLLTLRRS